MQHIEADLLEACILIALLVFDLALYNRRALIDPCSERTALATRAPGGKAPQVIRDMRLQPPESLVLDEKADDFEGVVGGTGQLLDGRYRHIQAADEAVECAFKLFVAEAEVW